MLKRLLAAVTFAAALIGFIPISTVTAVAAGERQMYSFPFDDESSQGQYFTSGESASVQWVNGVGAGHGDDTAIKVTHIPEKSYNSAANAIILTLPYELPAGGVYRVVAWVYAATNENPNKDTLTGPGFVLNGDYAGELGDVKFPSDFGTLPLDEWMLIDVTLPVQEAPVSRLDFRIVINDQLKHPDVWYCDNIEIYQIGELEEVAAPKENIVTEEGYPLITSNKHDNYEGFNYELWSQVKSDEVSMILTGGGTYKCKWDAENILFRTGQKLGSSSTYKDYGNITMEYAADYEITSGDVSYLCMYGWTEEPMVEFYIIENHGNYKPPGGVGFQGTYELDDGIYEVYVNTRVEQPSIQGTKTFPQYFAVRIEKRTEGTMTISEHFKEWEMLGLDMSGFMYEVSLCVEGYQGSGNANVYKHVLTVGDTVYGTYEDSVYNNKEILETEETVETKDVTETGGDAENPDLPLPDMTDVENDGGGNSGGNSILITSIVIIVVVFIGIVIASIAVNRKKR